MCVCVWNRCYRVTNVYTKNLVTNCFKYETKKQDENFQQANSKSTLNLVKNKANSFSFVAMPFSQKIYGVNT